MLAFFNRVPYMQLSHMIPGVNIIGGKGSVTSDNGARGVFRDPTGGFRGQSTLGKSLGSKEHLDWLEIDLNVAEIIIALDYKHKNECEWKNT